MDSSELTRRSLAFLRQILQPIGDRLANDDSLFTSPPAFIHLHARNICELGDDVLALHLSNRSRAAQIVVRPMLESLFSLAAAAKDPAFPAKKIVAEQEDQIKRFKKWIEADHYDEFQEGLEKAKEQIAYLRQKHSIVGNVEWDVWQTADAAKLNWHYGRDYFFYSGDIHAKVGALICHERPSNSDQALQSVIYIVLMAAEKIASALGIELSQTQVNEKTRLRKTALALLKS